MSGTITSTPGYGTSVYGGPGSIGLEGGLVGQLTLNSDTIRARLNTALEQESTGKIAGNYGGLGAAGARPRLDLRPAEQHLQTWQHHIGTASARLGVAQSALTQIGSIAAKFYAQTNNINNVGDSEVSSIAATAKVALQQVAQFLNTKSGDVYVFSGQDTATPPLTSTDPSVIGPELLATPPTTAPFSSTIGTAVPTVEVGEGQAVQVGLLANQNTLATSQPPTSGSYIRDILTSLATLANLTDGPTASTASTTAASVRSTLGSAVTALSDEQGALGYLQSGLTTRQATLAATQTALSQQVSNAEDVDAVATLTTVQSLQAQLQASYQLIAGVKSLTLSSYLSG